MESFRLYYLRLIQSKYKTIEMDLIFCSSVYRAQSKIKWEVFYLKNTKYRPTTNLL